MKAILLFILVSFIVGGEYPPGNDVIVTTKEKWVNDLIVLARDRNSCYDNSYPHNVLYYEAATDTWYADCLNLEKALFNGRDIYDFTDGSAAYSLDNLLPAARAVQHGRFVQGGIDTGQGGEIHDGAVTEALPHVTDDHRPGEDFRVAEKIHRGQPQRVEDQVDGAAAGQDVHQNTGHDDPGQEVGDIDQRLIEALELVRTQLIEQDRNSHRHNDPQRQLPDGHIQGIPDGAGKGGLVEDIAEVLQPDPGRAEAHADVVVLKGDDDAVQGNVAENKGNHHAGDQHGIVLPQIAPAKFFCFHNTLLESKSPCVWYHTARHESTSSMGIFSHVIRLPRQGRE